MLEVNDRSEVQVSTNVSHNSPQTHIVHGGTSHVRQFHAVTFPVLMNPCNLSGQSGFLGTGAKTERPRANAKSPPRESSKASEWPMYQQLVSGTKGHGQHRAQVTHIHL